MHRGATLPSRRAHRRDTNRARNGGFRAFGWLLTALAAAAMTAGCNGPAPTPTVDVIVVGAGIAGLSAALEAESRGAHVLLVEANSMGGGHAVKAGGFALVNTPLQQAKGYVDTPDIAYRDMMAWGEDSNPWWVRHYVENSRTEVYDWLTALGVKFFVVLDTPEDTVPRFHFTRGAAVNAVVPMMRTALQRERIEFLWNTEVTEILRRDGRMAGVRTKNQRSGESGTYEAPTVVLTTGGYQNDLETVRRTWSTAIPAPARLLLGAGENAKGSGLELAEPFGAALARLDHQVTFVNGLPDPRDPSGEHGLLTENRDAIWVDATGRRFTNEGAPSKVTDRAVLMRTPATHWLVFDADGEKKLSVRGAVWLSAKGAQKEIVANRELVKTAESIAALAEAAGLPPDALADTVQRYNRFVEQGMDTDFGRIGPTTTPVPPPIRKPPFYAVQLFPMTRKSMGGLAIDRQGRVLGGAGQLIRGLFAAGEVTGVAGINGSFGGAGTFLGPSVLTGRIAGRNAAALAVGDGTSAALPVVPTPSASPPVKPETITLAPLVNAQRPGYWHFKASHTVVLERELECASCHTPNWGPGPAVTREQRVVQLETCTRCH